MKSLKIGIAGAHGIGGETYLRPLQVAQFPTQERLQEQKIHVVGVLVHVSRWPSRSYSNRLGSVETFRAARSG